LFLFELSFGRDNLAVDLQTATQTRRASTATPPPPSADRMADEAEVVTLKYKLKTTTKPERRTFSKERTEAGLTQGLDVFRSSVASAAAN
jgi:hypothetical protein